MKKIKILFFVFGFLLYISIFSYAGVVPLSGVSTGEINITKLIYGGENLNLWGAIRSDYTNSQRTNYQSIVRNYGSVYWVVVRTSFEDSARTAFENNSRKSNILY